MNSTKNPLIKTRYFDIALNLRRGELLQVNRGQSYTLYKRQMVSNLRVKRQGAQSLMAYLQTRHVLSQRGQTLTPEMAAEKILETNEKLENAKKTKSH